MTVYLTKPLTTHKLPVKCLMSYSQAWQWPLRNTGLHINYLSNAWWVMPRHGNDGVLQTCKSTWYFIHIQQLSSSLLSSLLQTVVQLIWYKTAVIVLDIIENLELRTTFRPNILIIPWVTMKCITPALNCITSMWLNINILIVNFTYTQQ